MSPARADPRPSRFSDHELVALVLLGDARGTAELWRRYVGLVRALLRRTSARSELDDATQEVFLQLFSALPRLRQPSSLRSFVIGITLRVAGTKARRRRARAWLELTATGEVDERARGTGGEESALEAVSRLQRLLAGLSEGSRRVFVLRHVQGLDGAQIAEVLGVSLATAKRTVAKVTTFVFAAIERDPVLVPYLSPSSVEARECA